MEITGNVTIKYTATADLDLPAGLKIDGDLTVNAPKATVNNNATVTGTITIKDVKSGTWNELVSGNTLVFEAAGKTLKIADGVKGLTIKANATVITPKAVDATVENGVTVTVKADEKDEGNEVIGTGKEVQLDPEKEEEPEEPTIKSIEDIEATVEQGAEYTLPTEVEATMSDETKKNVSITWTPNEADTSEVGEKTFKGTVEGYTGEVTLTLTVTAKESEQGKATAEVTTTAGDNYDINPLGTVSVKLTYGDNIKTSDIEELTIELFNGENKLATNILQPKKLNDKEKASEYIRSPFNLGRSEEHSEWAWVRGKYNLQGTEVTQADLPNKVVATYKVDGKTYVSEITIEPKLTVPAHYEGTAAPENGLKTLDVDGVTKKGALFMVYGLNVEGTNRQKPSTLDEVKTFIDKECKVNFNANAIKVEDGKISITGSILSPADWNKVKANGDKKIPYRITLVKDGTSAEEGKVPDDAKVAKIAMYEDGVAVIEEIE